jgi:hypothetical protein
MGSAYKMPEKIRREIEQKAPIVTTSENSGRRYGDFTEYDIDSRGYQNIILYIQKGLSSYSKLIKGILKPVLQIQGEAGIKYRIIPFTFGLAYEPFYKGKYFDMRYSYILTNMGKIARILIELSGDSKSQNPSIIPKLFPKTSAASSYSGGKTGIKIKEDLLIVIGRKDQVYFDESIREEVEKFRKQILFVEIEDENVNWHFYNYQPNYLKIKKQGVKNELH